MPAPLLETKLYVPRPRRGLVPRPRLSERLNRGAASKLTLVSAPAGFGKTTLLAEWLAADRPRRPMSGGRVAVARPGRQRSRVLLDLRDRRAADGGTRGRRERAGAPAVAPAAADRDGADGAAQRARRPPGRRRAGARRLPRHRRARRPRRHGLPARPPAAAAAPGDRQPRRSRRCRWPGCARAASWSRSAPPTCASPPTRPRRTSTR